MVNGLKTALWAHQQSALNFALPRRGTLLALDLGTGKTLTAIAAACAWGSRRILVVSPHAVVGVWPREFARHSDLQWNVLRLDQGSIKDRTARAAAALAGDGLQVVVVNHEVVWQKAFATLAGKTRWDLLIVDECHRAKAAGGKLSRFLQRLSRQVPRRLGLSGTPLPHSPLDIYGQARFLDPKVFGTRYAELFDRYAVPAGSEGFLAKKVVRWQNLEEFEQKLATFCFRVKKSEALDLPPEIDMHRTCTLEPAARRIYTELEADFYAAVEGGIITAENALVSLLRLEQVVSGVVKREDGGLEHVSTAKSKLLADTLEDIPSTDPVVVFCRFVSDLDAILAAGRASGRRVAEISGRRKDGLTAEATMRADVDLVAVQLQAGGVGIDLTRAATAIYYSRGWNLGDILQSRARLHRPGQTRAVTYIHLVAEGTVDEVAVRALAKREDLVEGVLRRMQEAA